MYEYKNKIKKANSFIQSGVAEHFGHATSQPASQPTSNFTSERIHCARYILVATFRTPYTVHSH